MLGFMPICGVDIAGGRMEPAPADIPGGIMPEGVRMDPEEGAGAGLPPLPLDGRCAKATPKRNRLPPATTRTGPKKRSGFMVDTPANRERVGPQSRC
jgi:hypothetical protein